MLKRIAVFLIAALVAAGALAQGKKRIEKATDMPTFTYRMDGKLEDARAHLDQLIQPGQDTPGPTPLYNDRRRSLHERDHHNGQYRIL